MSGKTSTNSKRKFNEKTYDRLYIVVKKGKKDEYKAFAEQQGKSLNAFMVELMEERINSK